MNDKDFEKLIEDMAETYAEENQDLYLCYDTYADVTDYWSLYHAFIEGFKAGMELKEKK